MLAAATTLAGIISIGAGAVVYIEREHDKIDDKNVDVTVYEAQLADLSEFLDEADKRGLKAERRGLKRDIRQLDNIGDTRPLTLEEKSYRRELVDQLEEVDRELQR